MRHGKSAWDSGALTDHARPLAPRGARSAALVASELLRCDWRPHRILTSDARRAVETAERMAEVLGVEIVQRRVLYLGGPDELPTALEDVPDDEDVLVLGHNPGLSMCLEQLSGCARPLATADAALLRATDEAPCGGWGARARRPQGFVLEQVIVARPLFDRDADGAG